MNRWHIDPLFRCKPFRIIILNISLRWTMTLKCCMMESGRYMCSTGWWRGINLMLARKREEKYLQKLASLKIKS